MSIVRVNPRREVSEFYPPPYNFLAPKRGLRGTSTTISTIAGSLSGPLSLIPVAGPIIGAALQITAVIASFFKGCGATCTLTTQEVNQVEPYMQQNLAQYLAAPVSAAVQQEALANFDKLWQGVVQYCGQPSMASAGKACITDRQSGSCAYKTSPGGWQQKNGAWSYVYPGANNSGSTCWNWAIGYRDPIANDPRVAAAASSAAGSSLLSSAGGFNLQSLLLPALLLGGGLLLVNVLGDL